MVNFEEGDGKVMVRYGDEDEREKISWREIDRRKDRSPYAPKEDPKEKEKSRRSEWVMKKYRKEADKLFMGKKGTKQFLFRKLNVLQRRADARQHPHQLLERPHFPDRAHLLQKVIQRRPLRQPPPKRI